MKAEQPTLLIGTTSVRATRPGARGWRFAVRIALRRLSYAATATALATAALLPGRGAADALPFLAPGDARVRHLVQLEADEGNVPLSTTWPIPTLDLPESARTTLYSLQQPGTSADAGWFLSGAAKPNDLRTFDETPREKGEVGVQGGWAAGNYAGGVLRLSVAIKPQDGMHYRFDDSYASWRFGNWWVTLGEQQRWWGPGWDGSLILSNNARPMPSISLDRASAAPFATKWLSWIGPWRLTTFLGRGEFHDPVFTHPMLWGLRVAFRPLRDLELGGSRTAQWCRVRVCGLHAFGDVLLGKDNGGVNIQTSSEPGNQEIGWDLRWRLGAWPAAFYYQENGETVDARNPLLPRPRQTTDLVGFEFWSPTKGAGGWRTFAEWAGTTCGEFSFAASDRPYYNCAYNNSLIYWGYYYRNRVIGDSLQGDGRMLTVGGLYIDSHERIWEMRVRKARLNRAGLSYLNTLSPVAADLWNFETKVDGHLSGLTYSFGVGADRLSPADGQRRTSGRVFLTLSAAW